MTRYLLADTHFGDPGPLEYADRPFDSVGAMNDALVERWNAAVSAGDETIVVGDFAVPAEPTTIRRWLRRLDVAGERPHLAGALLPEGVPRERLAVEAEPLDPPLDHLPPGRPALDGPLGRGRRQAVEPFAVVLSRTAVVAAHAPTSSFAQKNPPVSLWCG